MPDLGRAAGKKMKKGVVTDALLICSCFTGRIRSVFCNPQQHRFSTNGAWGG